MPTIAIYAAKGGQGTTTIAAALAITHAHAGHRTLLVDTGHDITAVLGHPDNTHQPGLADYITNTNITLADITTPTIENLDLITRGNGPIQFDTYTYGLALNGTSHYDTVIIDTTTDAHPWLNHTDETILVTRPCYLAARRAINLTRRPDHIALINEPARSINATDIATITGAPVTATIPYDPAIARAIDAGLLATRLPRQLTRALRPLTHGAAAR